VTGQSTGNRVYRESHLLAEVSKLLGEFRDLVLRLGDGHPVARGNHDRRGLAEQLSELLDAGLVIFAEVLITCGGGDFGSEPAQGSPR